MHLSVFVMVSVAKLVAVRVTKFVVVRVTISVTGGIHKSLISSKLVT